MSLTKENKNNSNIGTQVQDRGIAPPQAQEVPVTSLYHNHELTDKYSWLRDTNWPDVHKTQIIEYLKQENHYYHDTMDPLKQREDEIYKEIIGRIKLEDSTVAIKKGDYYYYSRTEQQSQHAIFCRKHGSLANKEEILLDVNKIAESLSYFRVDAFAVSPDHSKLVYSYDKEGDERYRGVIKELKNNKTHDEEIIDILGPIVWHENSKGFFYTKLNANWRTDQVFYHEVGADIKHDKLIFKENDSRFKLALNKSFSDRFIFIEAKSSDTTEIWFIDTQKPDIIPQIFLSREAGYIYDLEHYGEDFLILVNDTGKNFRLAKTKINDLVYYNWVELIPSSESAYLIQVAPYQNKFAVLFKEGGIEKIRVYDYKDVGNFNDIKFPEPCYKISIIPTVFNDNSIRISYSSLITPNTIFEYDFGSGNITTLKTQEIPSGYDSGLYACEYLLVEVEKGVSVPVSIAYKKELFHKDGANPLYLYGYGSYGYSVSSSFRPEILSLLDRGMVFAIAHIRGGDELGYGWYEDGKLLKKKNTFSDFIGVAEHMVNSKYAAPDKIAIAGRSAGGLLIGYCINEHPELFKVAIAHVPFVDVLNTMLDETLPLTPIEFKEWGNPKEKQYFEYIKSYSPYDNVKVQHYPAIYVTASLKDPRVTYWEPAKWVAKLRKLKKDRNLLLFETNMEAGHAGSQGRFGRMREIAKEYNFIFKELRL